MRKFLIATIKWLLLLAILALIGLVCWRFYTNRQLAVQYVGDQSYLQTDSLHASKTVGISSRASALVMYAPLSMLSKQDKSLQVKHYDSDQEMWDAFFQDELDYIFVSLDQYALHAMSQSCQIIFPYAISQGLDTVVCVPNWDSLPAGTPRRLAYVSNTTSFYVAQYLANQRMDTDSPIQLVGATTPAEAQELLKSGQVDAASLGQPSVRELLSQGFIALPDWTPPAIYEVCVGRFNRTKSGFFVASSFRTLVTSLFNSLDKMQTMPGPLYTQIARASNKKRDDIRAALSDNIDFLTGTSAFQLINSGNLANQLQQAFEFWVLCGVYPAPLSAQIPSDAASLILTGDALKTTGIIDQNSPYREEMSQPHFAQPLANPEARANQAENQRSSATSAEGSDNLRSSATTAEGSDSQRNSAAPAEDSESQRSSAAPAEDSDSQRSSAAPADPFEEQFPVSQDWQSDRSY